MWVLLAAKPLIEGNCAVVLSLDLMHRVTLAPGSMFIPVS
jgi:hypothetical protein